jgi:hypothetical protein
VPEPSLHPPTADHHPHRHHRIGRRVLRDLRGEIGGEVLDPVAAMDVEALHRPPTIAWIRTTRAKAASRNTFHGAATTLMPTRACCYGWRRSAMDKKPRIFAASFGSVYPLYVQKAAKKGRTKEEVDEIITWLTGYSGEQVQGAIAAKVDFETFFARAPRMNPNARLIKGVVCGVRIEDIADPLMKKIRYLDKLIDELAKGKKMASILRQ